MEKRLISTSSHWHECFIIWLDSFLYVICSVNWHIEIYLNRVSNIPTWGFQDGLKTWRILKMIAILLFSLAWSRTLHWQSSNLTPDLWTVCCPGQYACPTFKLPELTALYSRNVGRELSSLQKCIHKTYHSVYSLVIEGSRRPKEMQVMSGRA